MATDFTYGNKTINSNGGFKPSGKNTPIDVRTRVNTFADIESIPVPYIGMIITVLEDETNSNKMTDYKVLSLKANTSGIANSVVDQVQRYVDYLGVSTGGGTGEGLTSEQAQQLAIAYEHSQVSHVSLDEVDAKITEATSNVTMLNQNGGTQLLIWAGTQQEYDELLVYDNNTVYLIEGALNGGTVTRYTITNNLTGVTTSNNAVTIPDGSTYEATLSTEAGYTVGNVTVTMGGVDITSTAYSKRIITISDVTGDIVITAEALQVSSIDDKYTVAYSLDEETVFTGSNNIETNIALFDSDKDFTIFADFTPSTNSVGIGLQNVLFRVKQTSSPWIGVDISMWNESTATGIGNRGTIITEATKKGIILGKMCTGISNDTTNRLKFVIKRVSSDKKLYFYDSQGLIGSYADAGNVATNTFNDTVKIGGQNATSTTFMACTTHAFKIFFDNVSEEDITTLLQ